MSTDARKAISNPQSACLSENSNGHDDLWWAMHHSYDQRRATMSLTCYLDDSGSDEDSPITTIGGTVMSRDAFIDFSEKWDEALNYYRISPPLHMADFVRPFGKHVGMLYELKIALFNDLVKLINEYQIYSLSVAINGYEFNSLLSRDVRKKLIGPYAMAFFCAVLMNQNVCEKSTLLKSQHIAYLVDTGFAFSDQLVSAHRSIVNIYKSQKRNHVGSLTFQSDDRVPALQAADMIAWSSRRRDHTGLIGEFKALGDLLINYETALFSLREDIAPHSHLPLPKDGIAMFADTINNWISRGSLPSSVGDIFR